MTGNSSDNLEIDVDKVLRGKLGRKARFVPRFVTWGIERLICQDHLNSLLRRNADKRGRNSATAYSLIWG